MKSTSHAVTTLILVMIIIVLASLFWFLYSDYDAMRDQADAANSSATRVAAMEQEAAQIRAEADRIQATRTELESELATAVFSLEMQEQESVDDQQTIQLLETKVAEQAPRDSIPEVIIITPTHESTVNLYEPLELAVVAFDPSGIQAVNIIFDNNPSLEIPADGETSVTIQEPWPLSEAGPHTAVVTAVNSNNISSQAINVTITAKDARSSQQIADDVANIIGPSRAQVNDTNSAIIEAPDQTRNRNTPILLQTFAFTPPQNPANTLPWGVYCYPAQPASTPNSAQAIIESPVDELALVQSIVREWQSSQFQFSQLLNTAPNDDARAALCALAAGHERWVLDEYIRRQPADKQNSLLENLPPLAASDNLDILTKQQNFGLVAGPMFINALTAAYDTTAVLDAWNQPPQSTFHILYPEAYAENDELQPVILPELAAYLGTEWTPVTTNVLGAFMLAQYLSTFVDSNSAATAVSGWRGDQYAVYQQGEGGPTLLAMQINWATEADAQAFSSLLPQYVNGRFSGTATLLEGPENAACWTSFTDETICLFNNGTQTTIVNAPEENLTIDTLEELIEP